MTLRGVIFDLGGTLVEYHTPRDWEWPGLEAFRAYLVKQGHTPPSTDDLLAVQVRHSQDLSARLDTDPDANLTQDEVFRAMLAEGGITLSPAAWDEARERYYQASFAHVEAVADAQATLSALRARGLKIAALSNTQWPAARLDHLLDRLDLKQYLPVRFYSCDEAAWKPWPEIFRRTLRALELKPEEAAYVGDYHKYDVKGSQAVGMRAVWFKRPGREPMDGVAPDATIEALPALLDVVGQWTNDAS